MKIMKKDQKTCKHLWSDGWGTNCIHCGLLLEFGKAGERKLDAASLLLNPMTVEQCVEALQKEYKRLNCVITAEQKERQNVEKVLSYVTKQRDQLQEKCNELEVDQVGLRNWINDLQKGMYVNCVYCGHRYGSAIEVPVTMADVLKRHIEKCPKHPMSLLKKENTKLQDKITSLIESLKLSKKALEGCHPVMNPDEPCIVFEAWTDINKQLEEEK